MSTNGYVHHWLCTSVVMSMWCCVHEVLCPQMVMYIIGYVHQWLCPCGVVSMRCYVHKWLCPGKVLLTGGYNLQHIPVMSYACTHSHVKASGADNS